MSEVDRLLRDAARYRKMKDPVWELKMLEKAFRIIDCSEGIIDYARMADIKRDIGTLHYKNGHHVSAIDTHTECSRYYKKAGNIEAYMTTLESLTEWCINFRDYWGALFNLELLVDYYGEIDSVKCQSFAYTACLCLLAHCQIEDLTDLFASYHILITDPVRDTKLKHMLQIYTSDEKPLNRYDWETLVFKEGKEGKDD